jgi:hypothetical protein
MPAHQQGEAAKLKALRASCILSSNERTKTFAGTGRRGFSEGRQTIYRQQYRHAA